MKVADYLAGRVSEAGIRHVFAVIGGGSIHLNDAFGHSRDFQCTYHHHEQAAAMAAEAYARADNTPALVLVTTGPGAVNALTGVLCAYMESIPMLVISGQARYATTVRGMGLPLRSTGVQEYDVTRSASPMTKYAVMVERKEDIRYALEKALYLMRSGRRGPVWLDVPLDIQNAQIEPAELRGYDIEENPEERIPEPDRDAEEQILMKLRSAKRPVLFGGYGVRAADAVEEFRELSLLLHIPVLTGMSSVDLVPENWPLYAGRTGMTGGRAGNLTMAGSDVFFSVGSRLSFLQTGFDYEEWARGAYVIANEIDPEELKKPNVHVELPVICSAKDLLTDLIRILKERGVTPDHPWCPDAEPFLGRSLLRKEKYPAVTPAQKGPQADGLCNLYRFYDLLSEKMPEGSVLIASCGTSRVGGTQAYRVKDGGRFITNSATASMGYGLPASIGLSRFYKDEEITVVNGEGCHMMNLQEMQTIATHALPIRIFLICNGGYHSIRQTEAAFFKGRPMISIGPESGDLGFPDPHKIADAFGFSYAACTSNETIGQELDEAMKLPLPALIEVRVSPLQKTEPKSASRQLPDGSLISSPLEDMAPFLPREELREALEIPMTDGEQMS